VKKSAFLLALLLLFSVVMPAFSVHLVGAVEDSWTSLEPMPTARSGFGVAVVEGKIYAIGGSNGTHRLDVNEVYDPANDTWTTKTSMPTARSGPAIAVYQNKIYVIGGIIGESDPTTSGYTGVNEVYDPSTDTWETMESMPTGSAYLDANVVGDKIYVICGVKHGGVFPFQQYADENQVYDPSNDSWSTKTPIPIGNLGYSSAVVDKKIYIIGAQLNQIYNPETDTWASETPSPTFVLDAAAGATTGEFAPKRIYVVSGMDEDLDQRNVASDLTQVYNPETDTWTTSTPIPTPRWSLGVAVVNDELYAIGGYDGETRLAVNEKYTPAEYIPEFPSWIILPMFLIVAVVAVTFKKRLRQSSERF
jgi:N-acetylneuraminic acid mutarotase